MAKQLRELVKRDRDALTLEHLPKRPVVVLAVFLVILAGTAGAETSFYESEPNNTPAEAGRIAGSVTVLGTMNDNDQDGFTWTVSDEDAQKRWVFELHGIPGRLTIADIIRVEFADNGTDVASTQKLTSMGTRDGYTPAITRELIFEPGEYLIGIAYAGGGFEPDQSGGSMFRPPAAGLSFGESGSPEVTEAVATPAEPDVGSYRLIIRESASLGLQPQPDNETRETGRIISGGHGFQTFETRESAWYALNFKPEDTQQRWDVHVQVPMGRAVDATLFDATGQQLDKRRSGPRGHLNFPDIVPGEQPFSLHLEPLEPGFITTIQSVRTGQRVAGEEAEPNGRTEIANWVDFSHPLKASINDPNDADFFKFQVDEAGADRLQIIRMESEPSEQQVYLCLHDANEVQLQCSSKPTPFELPDLLLSPGEYGLRVYRPRAEFRYTITLGEQGPVEPGREVEPNDELANATTVPANLRIKGRASGDETDFYQFLIAEEPQLWRFQLIGENIREFSIHDSVGNQTARLRPQAGQRRLRLENVFLLPGKHYARVYAQDGAEYTLLAHALGPPDPNGEREPNDDASRMQRLAVGQTRTGLLGDANDTDFYRFFLANWDHVELRVEPPPDGIVTPNIYWYGNRFAQGMTQKPGEEMVFAGVLPPGDYHIQLTTSQPSDAEYHLSLKRLPRWSCISDCEPSGMYYNYYGVSALPRNLVLEGVSGEWRDSDDYQLPALAEPSVLTIRTPQPVGSLMLRPEQGDDVRLQYDQQAGGYQVTVPAEQPTQLVVQSGGQPYRLELKFENGPQAPSDLDLPAKIELRLKTETVSAFRVYGQVVSGNLVLTNSGTDPLDAHLQAVTSDYRWRVDLDQAEATLAPGASTTVPVELRVPPDAWADRPVRISARAFDGSGRQVETWVDVQVDREAQPVDPALNWAIPDALRGGFNAAWIPFGGALAGTIPSGADQPALRDGFVMEAIAVNCCAESYGWKDTRPTITLQLPGDEAAPVAGLALNNFGVSGPYYNLRRGTLMLSMDGQTFEDVLSFETLPVMTEQYFALDEPLMARFASLRLEETYVVQSGNGGVTFGEWKVILAPGYDLSKGQGFNLASLELGGHLVWDWPPQSPAPTRILEPELQATHPRVGLDSDLEYVIGFHENRAAQIQSVHWTNAEGILAENALTRVAVAVSAESPIGPWQEVGEFNPGVSAETFTVEINPPVWARFVKLTGQPTGDSVIAAAPFEIQIRERPSGPDYRSILAEWGQLNPRSWYEEQSGVPPEIPLVVSNNTSRDKAAALAPAQAVRGQVQLARLSHWYRLTMPADANTLTLHMSGQPTVRTVLELQDAGGTVVPLRNLPLQRTPYSHAFEAFAVPGSELYIHVYEPPRNVIFSWDTSASVNAHLPLIYNSLAAFVSQVVPGQESANFVPFDEQPLLDSWLGEPYMLQTILNDYPRRLSSSSGEYGLNVSAHALAPLAGTKSIVIITDGAVVPYGPLWKEMRDVQPRIFSVGVAGEKESNINVMQDWAMVNGGHFTHLRYDGEMEVAFDRAATLMRRPADYTLEVETGYREAPGPGFLQVVAGESAETTGGAVELILDASGSMLQRMEGKRRIVIAKEVLTQAVREHVPAGTPVALRVFGHKEPGTCATELLMPLSPLDPEAAAATIANVQAKNLAKTPIADSLAAVPGDLGGGQSATVILVTDGEETCDGDPAAVIQSLADQGVDVAVNIVGFAIDNNDLAAQFESWAEAGGGRYFAADNQVGLSDAIESALRIPFTVYDQDGNEVASGEVGGEAVELERGTYYVAVQGGALGQFENVVVLGEDEVILKLE